MFSYLLRLFFFMTILEPLTCPLTQCFTLEPNTSKLIITLLGTVWLSRLSLSNSCQARTNWQISLPNLWSLPHFALLRDKLHVCSNPSSLRRCITSQTNVAHKDKTSLKDTDFKDTHSCTIQPHAMRNS